MAEIFVRGWIAHLVADFVLQSEWQATNKSNVRHPAGYVHAAIHFFCYLLVFPVFVAFALALIHWAIDLRSPLMAWRKLIGQTTSGPAYLPFCMLQDQAVHALVLFCFCQGITR